MKRFILYALPVVFLVCFLLRLPVLLPALFLPRSVYLLYDRSLDAPSVYSSLLQHGRIHLLADGRARRLDLRDFEEPESLLPLLAGYRESPRAQLERYTAAIAAQSPPLGRARILFARRPLSRDVAAARRIQSREGLPVEIEVIERHGDPLFLACSSTFGSGESSVDFDLLFSTDIRGYESIAVSRNGEPFTRLPPAALDQGRHFRTSLPAGEDTVLELEVSGGDAVLRRRLHIPTGNAEDPQLLIISDREGSASFLEGLYAARKVPLSRALEQELLEYPLLVFDGVPIRGIEPQLSAALRGIYQNRSTSVLFVSDSPSFGSRGDNPVIEEILPVELAPRSLKYLPDMGILILLDISASMSGEKLSLAKVSTLELIENLKDSDRISILAFWDRFRFLHGFEEKKNLDSEFQLAPLTAQGGTDLFTALEGGLNRLSDLPMPQRHVIILTDGKTREGDFDSLIEQALLQDITISTLAVGPEINEGLLIRLAVKSGGNFYRVDDLDEIPSLIFEDRREIARSSFGEDLFTISDFAGREVGRVSGMNLYAPKAQRVLLYENQYEDPLLLMEKRDRQLIMMLLSDMYGYYTKDFLSDTSVVRTLQRTFDAILQKNTLSIRIGESFGKVSLTASGEGLVDPLLAIYSDNRLIAEQTLAAGSFLTYSTEVPLSRPGRYTGILYSRGAPLTRIPLYFNGNMEGGDTESILALQTYKSRSFRALPAGRLYLVLFFLASIAVTFFSRQSLRSAGKGEG
ncbi:MAG: VWA domain-containing protein [Spirochaetales bacterium]|nr:VWA domain-containing protein [Spirochaetales bacterium]